jgi:amino acid adenylation domain-containing protein
MNVVEEFRRRARQVPGEPAIRTEDAVLTYRELDEHSDWVAWRLLEQGVRPESLVGICLTRSPYLVAAFLGVLKSGAAYVPLDPEYPRAWQAAVLDECRCEVVITDASSRHVITAAPPGGLLDVSHECMRPVSIPIQPPSDRALAYVLYTSGSTGRPKGVCVEYAQLGNYVAGILPRLDPRPGDGFAMVQPATFGSCLTMLYPALLSGGVLHLLSGQTALDPEALADHCTRWDLAYLKITPSHLRALLDGGDASRLLPRRMVVIGGEPAPIGWLRGLRRLRPGMRVLHHYGSTETTVDVTTWEVEDTVPSHLTDDMAILGQPIPDVQLHVLDATGWPVASGREGELHVGGHSVARGYLRRPDETACALAPDPFSANPSSRLFRTGDVVQLLPAGDLRFVGRADRQVKVRGHRIELGEIEVALATHPGVRQAAALCVPDGAGEQEVHAYCVARRDRSLHVPELKGVLAALLPAQALPHRLEVLPSLPTTPSGKVDRRALHQLVLAHPVRDRDGAGGEGLARLVALAWAEVIGSLPSGSATFLESGGDSLRSVRLAARLQQWTGRSVTAATVFEHPTFAELVAHLSGEAES